MRNIYGQPSEHAFTVRFPSPIESSRGANVQQYEYFSEQSTSVDGPAAPAATADPDGPAPSDGDDRMDGLVAAMGDLAQAVAASEERAQARERVIERLFEENDRLRAGERLTVLRPVVVDLQRLRNDLLRQAATLPETMTAPQMSELLRSFAFDAEQTLERCGVEVIRPEVGSAFDPMRHRAAAAVAAPTPDLDTSIAEVLSDGYLDTLGGRAISSASVRVYRWTPPPAADTADTADAPPNSTEENHV